MFNRLFSVLVAVMLSATACKASSCPSGYEDSGTGQCVPIKK